MPAKIDSKFKDGFVLSEENLAKIDDIIKKRFDFSGLPPQIKFEVHRTDDALITYETISDVVSEENSKRNKVRQLVIKCSNKSDLLKLNFEHGEPTSLNLSTEDRDVALLLTADIKEYLHSEVLIKKFNFFFRFVEHRLFMPLALLITFAAMLVVLMKNGSPNPINLDKSTIDQKLDYLINVSRKKDDTIYRPFIFLLVGMVTPLLLIFIKPFYHTDVFYWGKEIQKYDDQKKLRSNIFWGIIVSLIVGIIGSALYNGAVK